MKTVKVTVTHDLTIEMEDGADLESIIGEMDCEFKVCEEIDRATVIDSEMTVWQKL